MFHRLKCTDFIIRFHVWVYQLFDEPGWFLTLKQPLLQMKQISHLEVLAQISFLYLKNLSLLHISKEFRYVFIDFTLLVFASQDLLSALHFISTNHLLWISAHALPFSHFISLIQDLITFVFQYLIVVSKHLIRFLNH